MSTDKNILKTLLNKLLESRLQKLENKSQEQIKDLKTTKIQFKKQGELINQLNKMKIKKNQTTQQKSFDKLKIYRKYNNYKSPTRKKDIQYFNKLNLSPRKKKFVSRNAITPIRPQKYPNLSNVNKENQSINININKGNAFNNKYTYIKSRYKDVPPKNKNKSNNNKLCLTPEPKLRKKKINIKPQKLDYKINNINKDNQNNKNSERNINIIKREEDYKKRTIVSNIGLEEDQINFVLDELKKEEEKEKNREKNSNNEDESNNDNENESKSSSSYNKDKSSDSNSSNSDRSSDSSTKKIKQKYTIKNKDTIIKFGKFLISSDGSDIIKLLCSFLDKKTKINFLSVSKNIIRKLTYYIEYLYDEFLKINNINLSNTIESQINKIKKEYKYEDYDSLNHAFSLSKDSLRALELLNSETYNNIFKEQILKDEKNSIILIYRILFQLIDKEELVELKSDKKFWEKTRNFILDNNEGKTGNFIKEYISEFDFTYKNIYRLKKLVRGNEDKIKPLIYEKICKTTGIITFIIKDSLEYCGIIFNNKKTMPSIVINYLENTKNNINRVKDYIDQLKEIGN